MINPIYEKYPPPSKLQANCCFNSSCITYEVTGIFNGPPVRKFGRNCCLAFHEFTDILEIFATPIVPWPITNASIPCLHTFSKCLLLNKWLQNIKLPWRALFALNFIIWENLRFHAMLSSTNSLSSKVHFIYSSNRILETHM